MFYRPPGWAVWVRGQLHTTELRAVESVELYRADGYQAVYDRVDLEYAARRTTPPPHTLSEFRARYRAH